MWTMDEYSTGPGPGRIALFLVLSVVAHIVILFALSQHGNLFKSTRSAPQSKPLKVNIVELPKQAAPMVRPVPEPIPAPEPDLPAPDALDTPEEIPFMDDTIFTEVVKLPEEAQGEAKKPEGETIIAQKNLSVIEETLPEPGAPHKKPSSQPNEFPNRGDIKEALKEIAEEVSAEAAPLAEEKIQKVVISTPPPLQKERTVTDKKTAAIDGPAIKPARKKATIYENPLGPISAAAAMEPHPEEKGTLRPSDKSLFAIAADSGPAGTNLLSDTKKHRQVIALNATDAGYDLLAIVDPRLSLMSATIKDDYYNLHVKNRVQFHNEYPASAARRGEQGKVRVFFVIHRDGSVGKNDIELVRSSGYAALDDAALTAIRLGAKFNALPKDFEKEVASFDVTFNYVIVQVRRSEQRRR